MTMPHHVPMFRVHLLALFGIHPNNNLITACLPALGQPAYLFNPLNVPRIKWKRIQVASEQK